MEVMFALSSPSDKQVWQYIVGVAAHLEYLGIALLWAEDGRLGSFSDYENRTTFGGVVNKIEKRHLLAPDTVESLRAISGLRNSVAHRGAALGVPYADDGKRGIYRGRHVFRDIDALRHLVDDANAAIRAIGKKLKLPQPQPTANKEDMIALQWTTDEESSGRSS
jgi:hypothetical protein